MIDKYYDIITKIENFFDGIMVVDEDGLIRFNKQFSDVFTSFNEKDCIGKKPMEVYPNLTEETSTCLRALKYGETTVNKVQVLTKENGEEALVADNTFPIIENGKIIGAVSISKYLGSEASGNFIDLSHLTSTYSSTDMYTPDDIIGDSPEIAMLKSRIYKVSRTSSSVLIYGETGTGKELVAQSIHSCSSRRDKCFISQNCAAIPHTLLESIFFGTTKGSYTGAENKAGILEMANGGTVFLDEINSMDTDMQAKLLNAIEEKKITRIGGSETKKVDVRIIAAINETPRSCMENNRMRQDLYYRLSSIQIRVPPLRERQSDIPLLTKHFIDCYNRDMHMMIRGVSPEVVRLFNEYGWPGNVREFKNVIEGAFNFTSSDIIAREDLPEFITEGPCAGSEPTIYKGNCLSDALDSYERNFILTKSKQTKSLSDLADLLHISKQTLNYKIKKYNLDI